MSVRPRVVVLRGHHANIGELRPWELLHDRFEIEVVTTARADQQIDGLRVPWKTARTRRDRLPRGRLGTLATHLVGDAYRDTDALVREAAIVHTAELGPWFAAQPARLRQRYGFRLVTTVWETIPFRSTFRTARAAANRRTLLSETDLFLPTTERARALPPARGSRVGADPGGGTGHRRRALRDRNGTLRRRAPGRLARTAGMGEGPLRRDQGPGGRSEATHDSSSSDRDRSGAGCCATPRSRSARPDRDPARSVRRDAVRLRGRVVRRPRQPADQDLGGAVRSGLGRGACRRSTSPR